MPGMKLTMEQVQRLCGIDKGHVPTASGLARECEVSVPQIRQKVCPADRWRITASTPGEGGAEGDTVRGQRRGTRSCQGRGILTRRSTGSIGMGE
jgi:hypothetical protein